MRDPSEARVLLIDDEPANVALLERTLRHAGYEHLTGATDPREALAVFQRSQPDIVLLDLMMPHVDGFAVLEQFRAVIAPDTVLPIVVITADTTTDTRRRALGAGATDFLTKPFDVVEVAQRVTNLVQARFLHLELQAHADRLEDAVRQRTSELERFKIVLDSIREPVVIQDAETSQVLYANEAMARLFGTSTGSAQTMERAWPPEDEPVVQRAARPVVDHEVEAVAVELDLHLPGGELLPVRLLLQAVPEGDRDLLVAVAHDLSDQKRVELALRGALEREQEAARQLQLVQDLRDAFLTSISHEFRTPLTVMVGVAQTIRRRDQQLTSTQRQVLLDRLVHSGERFEQLLSDMVLLDALTRGDLELASEPVDVAALVQRRLAATDLGLRPVSIDADAAPFPIDERRVSRAVDCLFDNIVKHTPPAAPVEVNVRPQHGGVLIAVGDQGPGVPDELKQAIFEPFRQGPTLSPHSPGTGIGLALVAATAERHAGSAWVEDGPQGGAVFHVRLGAPGATPHVP